MGFTLVAATRTSTSPGPETGSGYSSNLRTSGPPYWWTTTAFIFHLLVRCANSHQQNLDERSWNWSPRRWSPKTGSHRDRFLALHSAFARHSAFGSSLFSVFLRMSAQVVP